MDGVALRASPIAEAGDDRDFALIEAEREFINNLYLDGELKDEGRRHIERDLDLRVALLANLRPTE